MLFDLARDQSLRRSEGSSGGWERESNEGSAQARRAGVKPGTARLSKAGILRDAIWFGRSEPVPDRGLLAYRVSLDEYKGQQRVQMVVEAMLG